MTYFLTADSADEYFEPHPGRRAAVWNQQRLRRTLDFIDGEEPREESDFSITSGTASGLDVNYDLRYDGAKDTQVIIVHVRPTD